MKIKNKTDWKLHNNDGRLEKEISRKFMMDPLVARLLINRGIKSEKDIDEFLNVSMDNLHSPELMEGMEKAVGRIYRAISKKEKLMIYGDYDVDGISATSLLIWFFKEIGVDVSFYIPHRVDEGYGLNADAIKKISKQGYTLLITVDCGVTSVDEVSLASELGLDVIITDHHQIAGELPGACAVLDPARESCKYPFKYLAGVGIAFKLLEGLEKALMEKKIEGIGDIPNLRKCLCLVALGTLADMVPLVGENRTLVRMGLQQMEKTQRVGLRALINLGNFGERPLTSTDIGFFLAPRLNAIGRLQHAAPGVELLMTDDRFRAKEIAKQLDEENRKRQLIQKRIFHEVISQIEKKIDLSRDRVIILASEEWHPGVIGIVASKVVERYNLPTILFNIKNGIARGSARSIPSFHIYNGLKDCSKNLVHFGGHKYAAGLSVKMSNMDRFQKEFIEVADKNLSPDIGKPVLEIDAEVPLRRFTSDMIEEIYTLGPFGSGNPNPLFLSRGVKFVEEPYFVGKNNEHVRFEVIDNGHGINGIAFGMASLFEGIDYENGRFDIVFTPTINTRGQMSRTVQLRLRDFRPAE